MSPPPADNQVVILVPGTLGSHLSDDDGNVWPGDWFDWIGYYTKIDRLVATDLKVGEIIRTIGPLGFYNHLIEPLEDCGFDEHADPPSLYTCPYDWRFAIQNTTTALANKVAEARTDHGEEVNIVLIGHSLGGLMCRYYLESGDFETNVGYENVSQLILMGVPNLGLPLMISLARGDEKHKFLSADQVKLLSNTPGLSAAYLMLPATEAQKVWENGGALPLSSYDLFSANGASNLGLSSVPNLAEAADFRARLQNGNRPTHVRYFSFVGTRQPTYSGATVETAGATPTFGLDKEERPDSGDGMVPTWSAWLEGEQGLAVGGEHGLLFKDYTLRSTLSVLLGCGPSFALVAGDPGPQLDIDDIVMAPGQPTLLDVRFDAPREVFDGVIRVSSAIRLESAAAGEFTPEDPIELTYRGPRIENLRIEWRAPQTPGSYRMEFAMDLERGPVARAEFFVQSQDVPNDPEEERTAN